MIEFKMSLQGAKELDEALKQLPRATSKAAVRKALLKAAEPLVDLAQALENATPRRTATKDLTPTIEASPKLKRSQQRSRLSTDNDVEIYIGSTAPDAHWKEFGTINQAPMPFMRPAWEATKHEVLRRFSEEIWKNILKSVRTLARKTESGTLGKATKEFLSR